MKEIKLGNRYFIKMRQLNLIPFIGWSYTTTSDPEKWVECEVVEIQGNYKIKLKSIEAGYGSEEYYYYDFKSMVRSGYIIEKTRDDQHVELVKWFEELTPYVQIEHSGYVVV